MYVVSYLIQLASQRQGKLLFIYNLDMQPRIFHLFEKNHEKGKHYTRHWVEHVAIAHV
jgi:hypothetical protein